MRGVLFLLSLASQIGFIIAVPAAVFGFGGAYLDRAWGTSPLFILLGLAIAIASSARMVWRLQRQLIALQDSESRK
ncbi:MAG: AtpZ/AtpI family protein [Patescibacteria group bacterium]|jgi:hypothetical protein